MNNEMQSSFRYWGNRIYDWMLLNFLWILTSILGFGFTVGAATGGLYYAIHFGMKAERRDVLKLYLKGVREYWRQTTAIWFLFLLSLGAIILVTNFGSLFFGDFAHWIVPFYGVLGLEVLLLTIVAIPISVQKQLSLRKLISISFRLAHTHIIFSILMLAVFLISSFLIIRVSLVFLYLIPSILAWWIDDNITNFMVE